MSESMDLFLMECKEKMVYSWRNRGDVVVEKVGMVVFFACLVAFVARIFAMRKRDSNNKGGKS